MKRTISGGVLWGNLGNGVGCRPISRDPSGGSGEGCAWRGLRRGRGWGGAAGRGGAGARTPATGARAQAATAPARRRGDAAASGRSVIRPASSEPRARHARPCPARTPATRPLSRTHTRQWCYQTALLLCAISSIVNECGFICSRSVDSDSNAHSISRILCTYRRWMR